MGPPFLLPPLFFFLVTFFFLPLFFPRYFASEDERFSACKPFSCGNFTQISYPFLGNQQPDYCGHPKFKLDCQGDNVTMSIASQEFRVIDFNLTTRILRIGRTDLGGAMCPNKYTNISLDYAFFNYTPSDENTTLLYDCDPLTLTNTSTLNFSSPVKFDCPINGKLRWAYFVLSTKWANLSNLGCNIGITVPVLGVAVKSFIIEALDPAYLIEEGFEVNWEVGDEGKCEDCRQSGGRCGYNASVGGFRCFCPNQAYATTCGNKLLWTPIPAPLLTTPYPPNLTEQKKASVKWHWKVIVGVVAVFISVVVMSIVFFFYLRRQKNSYAKSYIQSRATSSDSSLMDPEKGSKYFGVHLFTYTELEEATNYFDSAKELGDGGFGTVYFGKLRDGRCVAVKRLYENNYKRVEQFMNEVEILTRLRHQNLVSLYGCTSRHSRELLLVYEYIPNGTVADHLHGERAEPGSLPWHIRIKIAIETASALAYLHASDIIHRDVKTNNILLDDHFCVKVADFGLSRLFPNDVTHISTAPQGTPGYVDPEYHECYQLTDKSDVYSFGVVLIELISSMPAVDITRHRHEINLSTMAINKIQNRALHELVDPTLGFESDYKVRKMINAVAELAFQCLQSLKDMRPSMEEVLDTLRDIESDGKHKSKPEVMDISADDVVLLKNDLPPSPDSSLVSKSTTPNDSK